MSSPLQKKIKTEAYGLVNWQLLGIVIIAFSVAACCGIQSGYSALAGGLAYGLSNLFFVWLVFRYTCAQQMSQFMAAFFAGEIIKLFISAILFLLIVKYLPVSLLSELVGFVGAIISFWIVCVWRFAIKPQ